MTDQLIFSATQINTKQEVKAPFGKIVDLTSILKKQSWSLTQALEAESNYRENLFDGEAQTPTHHSWKFKNLRKTHHFSVLNEIRSELTLLEFLQIEEIICKSLSREAQRVCPNCSDVINAKSFEQICSAIVQGYADKKIALGIPLTQQLQDPLPLGYVYGIHNTTLAEITAATLQNFHTLVIDEFTVTSQSTSRVTEALRLALSTKNPTISVFTEKNGAFHNAETLPLGSNCPSCGFIAYPISAKMLREGIRGSATAQSIIRSYKFDERNLLQILESPFEKQRLTPFGETLRMIEEFACELLDPSASLLSLSLNFKEQSHPLLYLLYHLIQQTSESIFICEELESLISPEKKPALHKWIELLTRNQNLILIIQSAPSILTHDSKAVVVLQENENVSPHLTPGKLIINNILKSRQIDDILEESKSAGKIEATIAATLPSLSNISRLGTLAEASKLIAPLIKLYQSLKLNKVHNLSSAELLTPSATTPVPRFQGFSIAEILELSVEKAHEVLANIPSCAEPLSRLLYFNFNKRTLNCPVSELSLGERNLLRFTYLNHEPSRQGRIFNINFPALGLDIEQQKIVNKLIESALSNSHTVILTNA